MSPRPRLSEIQIEEHANALVDATFRVATATGNPSPSVRSILAEAGLSRQVFYRCFQSHDDLMRAVLAEGRRMLVDYLTDRMAKAHSPEEKVRTWVTGVMRQAHRAPERSRPFSMAPRTTTEYGSETEMILCGLLSAAIAAGNDDGTWDSPDPAADALLIHDFVFEGMRRRLVRSERPTQAAMQHMADFAVQGLAAVHAGAEVG